MSVAAAIQDRSWLRRLGETRSIAWYGIGLGLLAFWLALPPWDFRFEGGPIAAGIAGLAAGLWAVSRDEKRLGWWAVAVAIGGAPAAPWGPTKETHPLHAGGDARPFSPPIPLPTPPPVAPVGGPLFRGPGGLNLRPP